MIKPDHRDVRLLYFEGCPNWRVADARLKAALAGVGADPDAVAYEQVTTLEQAEALGFRGSPTILVAGADPFSDPDAPAGLTCRIYRTATGVAPAPSVEQLQSVLARREETNGSASRNRCRLPTAPHNQTEDAGDAHRSRTL